MKYLKNHFSLILALVSILFSIEIFLMFNKIVNKYSQKIASNYSIVVVSKEKLKNLDIRDLKNVELIDVSKNLEKLQKNLKILDATKLKEQLPYFYKLHFKKVLSPGEIEEVTNYLKKNKNILKIESFRATQNRIYNLLLLIKTISIIFMGITLFISFLLILKQMEVWKLEHYERMYIMELFGASFLLKSGVLLKIAIIDSFISVVIIGVILYFIFDSSIYLNLLQQLDIIITNNISNDLLMFLLISLSITIIATMVVILSKKESK